MNNKIIKALAKKFDLKEKDFVTFPFEGKTAIVHAGNNPYKGSYNTVMKAPKKDYEITVDKKSYDTRKFVTSDLYDALVEHCKKESRTLPDSIDMQKQSGDDWWTWTMITGEPKTAGGRVQFRFVYGGEVNRGFTVPGDDIRNLRVCPAVTVPLSSDVETSSELPL